LMKVVSVFPGNTVWYQDLDGLMYDIKIFKGHGTLRDWVDYWGDVSNTNWIISME
jgi:hypothetical protein